MNKQGLNMVIETTKPMAVVDFSSNPFRILIIQPGCYNLFRIKNPSGLGIDWLVLDDNQSIGASVPLWQEVTDAII